MPMMEENELGVGFGLGMLSLCCWHECRGVLKRRRNEGGHMGLLCLRAWC